MIIGAVDFETTGLDTQKDDIIEVGFVRWDTDSKSPVGMYSSFVWGPTVPKEITEITGITNDDLNEGKEIYQVANDIHAMIKNVDYIVAHNGTNFDKHFWDRQIDSKNYYCDHLHWIDTSVDVPYPKRITTRKLTHLAAEHGFLNPFPHRALFDVLTMMKILSQYDINEVIRISKTPSVTLIADVNYHTKEPAKAAGFRWYADEMKWKKTLKEDQIEEYPFAVIRAEGQSPAPGEAK